MTSFSFYGMFEEAIQMLRDIMELHELQAFHAHRLQFESCAPEPTARIDEEFVARFAKWPETYLAGPFTTEPLRFNRIEGESDRSVFALDPQRGGAVIKFRFALGPRIGDLECKRRVVDVNGGEPPRFLDPPAELQAAFDAIVATIQKRLVCEEYRDARSWISPGALAFVQAHPNVAGFGFHVAKAARESRALRAASAGPRMPVVRAPALPATEPQQRLAAACANGARSVTLDSDAPLVGRLRMTIDSSDAVRDGHGAAGVLRSRDRREFSPLLSMDGLVLLLVPLWSSDQAADAIGVEICAGAERFVGFVSRAKVRRSPALMTVLHRAASTLREGEREPEKPAQRLDDELAAVAMHLRRLAAGAPEPWSFEVVRVESATVEERLTVHYSGAVTSTRVRADATVWREAIALERHVLRRVAQRLLDGDFCGEVRRQRPPDEAAYPSVRLGVLGTDAAGRRYEPRLELEEHDLARASDLRAAIEELESFTVQELPCRRS